MLSGATGPQASPTWQSYATDVSPTARTHTVTGLRPAESYQFQVSAVNAVGRGEPSAPSQTIKLPEQRMCHVFVVKNDLITDRITAGILVTLNNASDYRANGLLSDYIGRTNGITD